jgi:2'-5' RNA ligase
LGEVADIWFQPCEHAAEMTEFLKIPHPSDLVFDIANFDFTGRASSFSTLSPIMAFFENERIKFKLDGFHKIENKVIYADVKPSEELKMLRKVIAENLSPISKSQPWDSKDNFIFHGTIAFKDIEHKFDKIWEYVENKEK